MAIIAIESALDLAIMFGDRSAAEIYAKALADAGVQYESHAGSWLD